jgi:hypothetical protein
MNLLGACDMVVGTTGSTFSVVGMLMGYEAPTTKTYHLMTSEGDIPAFI